jgi:hypothetical protein
VAPIFLLNNAISRRCRRWYRLIAVLAAERPMHKFSTRNLLIFVIGLVLAVVLIGLGVAHVVQLKHRILSGNSNNALTGRAQTSAWGTNAVTKFKS